MRHTIPADTLNEICGKDLSVPVGIYGTAAEVSAVLTVPHVLVTANNSDAIVRESNSRVVVLTHFDDLHHSERAALLALITKTRWRKALIIPHRWALDDQFHSRLMNVELEA